jgi:dUTPase
MNTLLPVKLVMKEGARLPLKHTDGSCGRDLLTIEEVILQPGELRIIDTGMCLRVI